MTATVLDWRRHRTGSLRACVRCSRPALCRNEHNQPCHKTCAETGTQTAPADSEQMEGP